MFLSRLASLVLAAATLLAQSVTADPPLDKGCVKPSVRREWRSLSPKEREEWMTAVKCLSGLPHSTDLVPTFNTTYTQIPPVNASSSYFDDFVYIHMDLNPIIHFTGQFLPWHRAYVKDFETALQEKCGYKGTQPYWDWTKDASNFQNSTFWDTDSTSGIGGWGDPNNDYQINTGGFADFVASYPVPHKLRRQYSPVASQQGVSLTALFTPESQEALIHGFVGDYIHFQGSFEGSSHGAVHRIVGGDLFGGCPAGAGSDCVGGPKWSPNDPLFMLHHGMVDKIWSDWQNANPYNYWSYSGGATAMVTNFVADPTYPNGAPPMLNFSTPIPTDGILKEYTIYELMHIRNERLCYVYE